MPLDRTPQKQRIAIIGGGVSGLAAAYELSGLHNVTLFEASVKLGGHARTVMAGKRGDVPVDTGFIVYNRENYPELTRMFSALNVPVKPSEMSFGASIGDGKVEYALQSGRAVAAQKSNLLKPQFWRMFGDIIKFQREALRLATDPNMTLGEFLDELKLGSWFRDYYLLPMSGAIWSSTPEQMARFPAKALVQFFENHSLLNVRTHQWYTVDGGSIEYVRRIEAAIRSFGGRIRTSTTIKGVRRSSNGHDLQMKDGSIERFDQVIFACHSDQALDLIDMPTERETAILGNIRYQDNKAVLHADERQMPQRKNAWASWVYRSDEDRPASRIGVTYWMNNLQGLDKSDPLFLSLNPGKPVREELIYDETTFSHPVFDRFALRAQEDLPEIQGQNNTWFCGAWTRHGFHEDGYASGADIARTIIADTTRTALVA